MKPRVNSGIAIPIGTDKKGRAVRLNSQAHRVWHVTFEDACGCEETEHFSKFSTALRFAYHVGAGGSRWEFVA